MTDVIPTLLKMAIASLFVGAMLSYFGLGLETILAEFNLTPSEFYGLLWQFVEWALPNMVLGAIIIVPIWLIIILILPARTPYDPPRY